jgi:hypothetical protein
LPFDLRQQKLLLDIGAVNIARSQSCGHAVVLDVEQQQRVLAGGFIVLVVGVLFLLSVDRNLGAVQ